MQQAVRAGAAQFHLELLSDQPAHQIDGPEGKLKPVLQWRLVRDQFIDLLQVLRTQFFGRPSSFLAFSAATPPLR